MKVRVYRKGEAPEEYKWKGQSNALVVRFPDRVRIHRECQCSGVKKEYHHFDYYRPWDVMLLCKKCHGEQHHLERSANNL